MRNCPNCGGGLKYDIAKKQLGCPNCSSSFPVDSIPEARMAQGAPVDGTMQAMVFTCPQCGGEVMSTSETAAGFCSFCGASVQLQGRMVNGTMPAKIIPFKITKQQCVESFKKYTGGYFFTPADMRKDGARLEFRGIYMPYWNYTVHQQGHVHRTYKDEYRSGDYRIINHYNFDCDLNNNIENIQHDASLSFNDDIGIAISPFSPEEAKEFNSGYMEGFYADLADTKAEDYAKFAIDAAVEHTEKAIDAQTKGVRTDRGPRGNQEFNGAITEKGLSLFPVWFMSYKSGERVAYSAVNGQTGKVYVDLPVSLGRFFGLTAIITAVLFVLANLFITPTPQMDVGIAMILSTAASLMFTFLAGKILERDGLTAQKVKKEKENKAAQKPKKFNLIFWVIVGIILIPNILVGLLAGASGLLESRLPAFVAIIAAVIALAFYLGKRSLFVEANGKGLFPAPFISLIAAVLGLAVMIVNPVSDFLYYGITIVAMVMAAISLISVISLRNLLCTRRLPEFDTHKGGDHRAK